MKYCFSNSVTLSIIVSGVFSYKKSKLILFTGLFSSSLAI